MKSLLLAGLLVSPLLRAADAPPPIADFVRPARIAKADLSPDGRYLATLVDVAGVRVLRFSDLESNKDFVVRAGKDGVAGFVWVSDKRVVYWIGESFGGLEALAPTGELLGVDADGGGNQYLFGFR